MSAFNTAYFYRFTLPCGSPYEAVDAGDWDGAAPTTLTVQPGTDECILVKEIVLKIDTTFAITAGDEISITANAYGDSTYYDKTIDNTNTIDKLIRLGDPRLYEEITVGGTNFHIVTIQFEPRLYLRSSTTTAESLEISYNDVAGGVTAGSIEFTVRGWTLDEDDSGLSDVV